MVAVVPGTVFGDNPSLVGAVARGGSQPDWTKLAAGGVTLVHILKHGRPYCGRFGDKSEPEQWETFERWIGFCDNRVIVLSCPADLQCSLCYDAWIREHYPESAGKPKRERKTKTKGATGMDVTRPAPGKPRARTREPVAPADMLAEIDRETGMYTRLSTDEKARAERTVQQLEQVLGIERTMVSAPGDVIERILGIDPGFATIAVFVLELTPRSAVCLYRATFHTSKKTADKQKRMDSIIAWLFGIFEEWQPTGVAYEGVAGVNVGKEMRGQGNADRSNLIKVCGVIRALAYCGGPIRCEEIAVSSARVAALGKGNSRGKTKKDVRAAVERLTGSSKLTLDQADAGALALAFHARRVAASKPKLSRRQAAYKPRSKDGHEVAGAQATGKGNASRNAPAKRARKRNPPRHPAGEATLARSLIRSTDV